MGISAVPRQRQQDHIRTNRTRMAMRVEQTEQSGDVQPLVSLHDDVGDLEAKKEPGEAALTGLNSSDGQ
jgi:hypothetical protein